MGLRGRREGGRGVGGGERKEGGWRVRVCNTLLLGEGRGRRRGGSGLSL